MTSTVPREFHIVYLQAGFAMEPMNVVIKVMKKLSCVVRSENSEWNFLMEVIFLLQSTGHVVKNNLYVVKIIPNAFQKHKCAMHTKIALTEVMRIKTFAVRVSESLFACYKMLFWLDCCTTIQCFIYIDLRIVQKSCHYF